MKSLLEKQLRVAAQIADLLKENNVIPVIVGGTAVEFYTHGAYATKDIDIIVEDPEFIVPVMKQLGFINEAGTWYLPDDPSVIVEFPKGPLAGDWKKVQPVLLPDGHTAYVIALEDIILDRMLAATYWKDGSDEWVRFMMTAHYDEIDWPYLRAASSRELCLDEYRRSREWSRKKRNLLKKSL